jgi:hypothetical protein
LDLTLTRVSLWMHTRDVRNPLLYR